METELARLEAAMSDPEAGRSALARYGPLQQEFERRGGYTYETRIRQTLTGLGFDADDYHRPLPQLSGGQRTRAVLARLLLSDPDLLILDEPTNHLDIAAVEWLEGYLSQWEGAALIVSHDRYFLDRVVDHIWEMSRSGHGSSTAATTAPTCSSARSAGSCASRALRRRKRTPGERAGLHQAQHLRAERAAGQRASCAALSRDVEAIEKPGLAGHAGQEVGRGQRRADTTSHMMSVDEVERRIHGLREPAHRPPHLHLNLKTRLRSGDLVLRTYDLDIGYADEGRPLFHAPDLVLKRGECAALIGPNGAGKTTFLKTLLQRMPPLSGEVLLGASLDIAYFAQAHEDLHPERTLVEEIDAVAPHMLLADIRDYLARFLFTGEDVFKQGSSCSRAESAAAWRWPSSA